MLKIWGRANSVNVMKALWAADEVGRRFERVDIGGPFGGNDQPAYLALNPNGRIPTIEDDGFVLWESNAIVRYLAARYGAGTLWPDDVAVRATADAWMDWQQTTAVGPMTTLFWGLVRTAPDKRDPAALEAARRQAAAAWTILDRTLERTPFVAGARFTMGDIPAGALVHRWFALDIERPDLPALAAWYARLKQRPGYAHVNQKMS
ncbi:MAG: glutathione S-transferase family protein [Alphaproteobacteria bacterium]|nr:glutathione S-transferase family protein [Alphaproteobacteria bacterium]